MAGSRWKVALLIVVAAAVLVIVIVLHATGVVGAGTNG
jgi:Flp pilus assembly protein protease CpaA